MDTCYLPYLPEELLLIILNMANSLLPKNICKFIKQFYNIHENMYHRILKFNAEKLSLNELPIYVIKIIINDKMINELFFKNKDNNKFSTIMDVSYPFEWWNYRFISRLGFIDINCNPFSDFTYYYKLVFKTKTFTLPILNKHDTNNLFYRLVLANEIYVIKKFINMRHHTYFTWYNFPYGIMMLCAYCNNFKMFKNIYNEYGSLTNDDSFLNYFVCHQNIKALNFVIGKDHRNYGMTNKIIRMSIALHTNDVFDQFNQLNNNIFDISHYINLSIMFNNTHVFIKYLTNGEIIKQLKTNGCQWDMFGATHKTSLLTAIAQSCKYHRLFNHLYKSIMRNQNPNLALNCFEPKIKKEPSAYQTNKNHKKYQNNKPIKNNNHRKCYR